MVLPLIGGLIGVLGVGFFSLIAVSQVVYWISLTAAIVIGFLTFRFLFNDRPFDIAEDKSSNNILYLMLSLFTGIVSYKLVNTAFIFYGATLAVVVAAVLTIGYFIGFRRLVSFIAFVVEQFSGVGGGRRR